MPPPELGAPAEPPIAGSPRHHMLRTVLPHVITAVVAVALSLVLQSALLPPPAPLPAPATIAPTATTMPAPPAVPTVTMPTTPPVAEGIARQELTEQRAEIDRIYSMMFLYRAVTQIADAEALLRDNNFTDVDQTLVAVDDSLALAYERADTAVKDPIDQFRREVGAMHSDLFVRPEGMDGRLTRLRQQILSLVDERQ